MSILPYSKQKRYNGVAWWVTNFAAFLDLPGHGRIGIIILTYGFRPKKQNIRPNYMGPTWWVIKFAALVSSLLQCSRHQKYF